MVPDTEKSDQVLRYIVEELAKEVADLRKRVDGLLWLAASALIMDAVMRVAGIK